jgi:hypothetical protein
LSFLVDVLFDALTPVSGADSSMLRLSHAYLTDPVRRAAIKFNHKPESVRISLYLSLPLEIEKYVCFL